MPYTIHTQAMKKQMFWNQSRPQEVVQKDLAENWNGTPGQGLPVIEIPHFDFPCVVYKHPRRPFRQIEHRNDNFEVVGTERIPTEHKTKTVCCDAHKAGGPKECKECNKALDALLAKGWTETPYIPKAVPKPDEDLYGEDDDDSSVSLAPPSKKSARGTAENPL